MGVRDELVTAAQCIEGARQALARAADIVEDDSWLNHLATLDKKLHDAEWTGRHLLRIRREE